ncbi:hypothetical protein LshimejAT787_0705780 [Lyophyllum shimeji]|uniref:Uncharacterized protein n=1 Tax=Lyophyllum shimeji TaxID=47721 RepID=A0A9P3PR55_LYOSH|nr:hypothetical protein LshimejAT787_0705780 [Lyophyllum shimeji]
MSVQRPISSTFLSFFIVLSLLDVAGAQLSIRNISTSTVIDLYRFYNGGGGVTAGTSGRFTWDIYDGDAPFSEISTALDSSVEIISGPAEGGGDDVVDLAVIHDTYRIADYYYPTNLPLGLYHARITSTLNTTRTIGQSDIQRVTARSATINVTTSSPIGCGSKVPAPFTKVTSPSSSGFTSMYVEKPSAGYNVGKSTLPGSLDMPILLQYRDQRNFLGKGITNVTAQILDSATSKPVGSPQSPTDPSSVNRISVKFSDVPMEIGGSYKIQLKYRNNVQDGIFNPGELVTFTTEAFNVVTLDDWHSNCGALSSSGSDPSGSGSGSGSSSGAGNTDGGHMVLPGLYRLPALVSGLMSVLWVM